ncbi:MAG: DNA primase, partial [Nitrososphaerales archaeon]
AKIADYYSKSTPKKFEKVIDRAVRRHGARIDSGVTIDIHRIFRLPGSLHEKTGLAKMRCGDLDSFDPTNDPVEIKNEPIKVQINMSPPFKLKDQTYGPYKSEEVILPLYAGAYLMANNLAQVVGS